MMERQYAAASHSQHSSTNGMKSSYSTHPHHDPRHQQQPDGDGRPKVDPGVMLPRSTSVSGGADDDGNRLLHRWTFWFIDDTHNMNYKEFGKKLQPLGTFDTVEEFWSIYSFLKRPKEIGSHVDYYLFQTGIQPMWEDDNNKHGGHWMLRLKKQISSRLWEELVLSVIGGRFDQYDLVCGIMISLKGEDDVIQLWHRDSSKPKVKNDLKRALHEVFRIPVTDNVLEYREHDKVRKQAVRFGNNPAAGGAAGGGGGGGGGGRFTGGRGGGVRGGGGNAASRPPPINTQASREPRDFDNRGGGGGNDRDRERDTPHYRNDRDRDTPHYRDGHRNSLRERGTIGQRFPTPTNDRGGDRRGTPHHDGGGRNFSRFPTRVPPASERDTSWRRHDDHRDRDDDHRDNRDHRGGGGREPVSHTPRGSGGGRKDFDIVRGGGRGGTGAAAGSDPAAPSGGDSTPSAGFDRVYDQYRRPDHREPRDRGDHQRDYRGGDRDNRDRDRDYNNHGQYTPHSSAAGGATPHGDRDRGDRERERDRYAYRGGGDRGNDRDRDRNQPRGGGDRGGVDDFLPRSTDRYSRFAGGGGGGGDYGDRDRNRTPRAS